MRSRECGPHNGSSALALLEEEREIGEINLRILQFSSKIMAASTRVDAMNMEGNRFRVSFGRI